MLSFTGEIMPFSSYEKTTISRTRLKVYRCVVAANYPQSDKGDNLSALCINKLACMKCGPTKSEAKVLAGET